MMINCRVGLTNAHDHLEQFSMRGIGDGLTLEKWLESGIRRETKQMSPVDAFLAYASGLISAAQHGVSCTHHLHKQTQSIDYIRVLILAAHILGVRLVIFRSWRDSGSYGETAKDAFIHLDRLSDLESRGLIKLGLGIGSLWNCSDAGLREVAIMAKDRGMPIQAHVAETSKEREDSILKFRTTPIRRLARAGLLSPQTELVHAIHLDEEEWSIVNESGSKIVHCPSSNLLLRSGDFNIIEASKRCIPMGVGTDGAASSIYSGPLQEALLAVCLARRFDSEEKPFTMKYGLSLVTNPIIWDCEFFSDRLEDRVEYSVNTMASDPDDLLGTAPYTVSSLEVQGQTVVKDGRVAPDKISAILKAWEDPRLCER